MGQAQRLSLHTPVCRQRTPDQPCQCQPVIPSRKARLDDVGGELGQPNDPAGLPISMPSALAISVIDRYVCSLFCC